MTKSVLPALALASACLLLGSTGGAMAGSMVTGKQIKNESVTGRDVKNGSLTTPDLDAATVSGLRGAQGPPGVNGVSGVSGLQMRFGAVPDVPNGGSANTQAACDVGTRAVGGGAGWFKSGNPVSSSTVSASVPLHAIRNSSGTPAAYVDATL